MKANARLVIAALVMLLIGVTVGYIGGTKRRNAELEQLLRSLAIVHSAKEAAYYTRLLEGLRAGNTDLVKDRLETMLDDSVARIGMQTEFKPLPPDLDEALNRSLCLARKYRALYPHRPLQNWEIKYYDAALAPKTDGN